MNSVKGVGFFCQGGYFDLCLYLSSALTDLAVSAACIEVGLTLQSPEEVPASFLRLFSHVCSTLLRTGEFFSAASSSSCFKYEGCGLFSHLVLAVRGHH